MADNHHPAPGWIRLEEDGNPHNGLPIQLGSGAAVMGGGYGGWVGVGRPRTTSLIEWQGHQSMQLSIPVMFDGWIHPYGQEPFGTSVEYKIEALEDLCEKHQDLGQPPVLLVFGAVPGTNRKWVLNDIEWNNEDIRRPSDGQRVRSSCTLILIEYIDEDLITSSAKRHKSKSSKNVHTKRKKGTYIVKEGDTLQKIAKRELGSAHKWHEIAKLNKIRDGKAIHTGQHLRMP